MKASVREATENDVTRLAALGAETFISAFGDLYSGKDLRAFVAESHSPAAYRNLISNPDCRVWIAENEGVEPIGYAVGGPCGLPVPDLPANSGELKRIYMKEGVRGGGVGACLLSTALDYLRARFDRVYLSVYSENHAAHRFYERFGFVKIGDYFFMVGEQADAEWIMELKEHRTA